MRSEVGSQDEVYEKQLALLAFNTTSHQRQGETLHICFVFQELLAILRSGLPREPEIFTRTLSNQGVAKKGSEATKMSGQLPDR